MQFIKTDAKHIIAGKYYHDKTKFKLLEFLCLIFSKNIVCLTFLRKTQIYGKRKTPP